MGAVSMDVKDKGRNITDKPNTNAVSLIHRGSRRLCISFFSNNHSTLFSEYSMIPWAPRARSSGTIRRTSFSCRMLSMETQSEL